jgi:predicted transcriptional regulator
MKTKIHLRPLQKAREKTSITEVLERAKETCEFCRPLTPITCVTTCNIWKLKNELKKLYRKTENPSFKANLLNALKNKRRLQILEMLSNEQYSMVRLQQKLKKLGYYHSRRTIAEEYVNPLIDVGLVEKNHNKYYTTLLGCKLNESIRDFSAIGELLPPHSECYEEEAIKALSESPKIYEELKFLIPTESLSRVLKRLQETKLITNISLRRTYKYLRKLRGKKLAFKRKRPKTYDLTGEGRQIAKLLEKMHVLLIEFAQASAEFTTQPLEVIQQISVPDARKNGRKKSLQILVKSNA